jgi:hypothetical protein
MTSCVANAIIVTANVFEALSEINAKFAKIIDKECDVISGDVQKWFKKLAVSPSSFCMLLVAHLT